VIINQNKNWKMQILNDKINKQMQKGENLSGAAEVAHTPHCTFENKI